MQDTQTTITPQQLAIYRQVQGVKRANRLAKQTTQQVADAKAKRKAYNIARYASKKAELVHLHELVRTLQKQSVVHPNQRVK